MVEPIDSKNVGQLNTDSYKHITDPDKIDVLMVECKAYMSLVSGLFVKDNEVWAHTGELKDSSYLFRLN